MTCKRCGRVLRSPKSRERGMGPTCAKRTAAEEMAELERMGQMRLEGV